jgi:hypothetical protein
MNNLFVLQAALAGALNADPVLCLAHAAAWLDPLRGEVDEIDTPESEQDSVLVALQILRRAFPESYFDVLQAIRHNATYQQLEGLICAAVQAQGIPLEHLEWIGWGIPLPAYGATLDDPDFYTTHPDVLPVLACFGISPEPNPYDIHIPDIAYKVADFIAEDLLQQAEDHWRQVGWLLKWLFSSSGNSSVDYDHETLSEFQPLSWDREDIAFAREIIQEADTIMQDATAGLEWISQNPTAIEILSRNIRKIYLMKGKNHARYRIEWSGVAECDERTTAPVA